MAMKPRANGTKRKETKNFLDRTDEEDAGCPGAASGKPMIFVVCFAWQGVWTKAMKRIGYAVKEPQDLDTCGVDFSVDDRSHSCGRIELS